MLGEHDLPGVPGAKLFRAEQGLDGPLHDATLQDYLRALRVVAGQVRLVGEEREWPIERVFVAMEVQRQERTTTTRMREHEDPKRNRRADEVAREPDRPDQEEIEAEFEAREATALTAEAPAHLETMQLDAETVAEAGARVLVWGAAGTGKSTLLKWVACQSARSERTPIWMDQLEVSSSELPDKLAQLALRSVLLPETASVARRQLRNAIEAGKVQLLLDGLDEAAIRVQTSLPACMAALGAGTRVVIASRPNVQDEALRAAGFVPVTLTGLQGNETEVFLQRYFGKASWIAGLLRELRTLSVGEVWSRTPVLLSLVAALYQRNRRLPHATLALYDDVVESLIRRAATRWGLDPNSRQVREARAKLEVLARAMLLPREGQPEAAVRRREVDDLLVSSGLFTGATWLRFAHLSLGEFLAACAPMDLDEELERFRSTSRLTLDVLPMALARRRREALEQALRAAEDGDTWDHRLLGLVLRAAALGGEGEVGIDRAYAQRVLKVLVARLMLPSGRFGKTEQQLAAYGERGFRALGTWLTDDDREMLEPLLEGRGALGTEALLLAWASRLEGLRRPPSEREASRVGAALVRSGATVADVIALAAGNGLQVRVAVVSALGSDPESRPLLREALRDADEYVRAAAVSALGSDPESRPLLREALRDAAEAVREAVIAALQRRIATEASALSELGCVQPAICLVGRHPVPPDLVNPSTTLARQERLGRFLQSPRPIRLEKDMSFAEELLGAVCIRLTQTTGPRFGIFGEVEKPLERLVDSSEPIVIRIAMSAADLALDRAVFACHNLVEAWRIARHLRTERNLSVWLVCADLDFDDIVPPALDKPGTVYMRPPFFGFRLPAYDGGTPLDAEIELLISCEAERLWANSPDQLRAELIGRLDAVLRDPDTDIWSLLPLLGRLGQHLPADLRAAVVERLPDGVREAVLHLERAREALGVSAAGPSTGAPGSPSGV
ncbi:large ATP-binding protein [Chondromyces apiculatus DSM 436]|uniref:Large ATP-binding protein n=1 Tax=Chondromyces apiculatus DSM 436 TaxID=1192034 RepID=A0A017T079_9BACT|nr:large ATP-binding protein [Chondromyces apiculatus DSM 436]